MATRNTPSPEGASKGEKFKSAAGAAGAAAGGFVGAMGQSFVPPVNITFNSNRTQNVGGGGSAPQGGRSSHFILGEPSFNTTDDVRNYCNGLRAVMIQAAIELAMAAKILEARLGQSLPLPGENAIQTRMRAKKVAWKLKRSADGATAAAKNAVATYAAFQREYADLMRPRPQQAPTTNPFRF
ncbi:plasmid transfer protein TraA [Streptomyces sp. NRRL S-31]|uniref:plasmid transfer protein TraA n=1 Tax=Streptomyces sp. NRRL S-31 TaxID=1463898 RepID=UPI000ACEA0F1|nr:plasmid transfer protein TraA [Streptomyces sp. NRRL S-31]